MNKYILKTLSACCLTASLLHSQNVSPYEQFSSGNDLEGLTLTFTPTGGEAYLNSVSPIGAYPKFSENGSIIANLDDTFSQVNLANGAFPFMGTSYASVYVSSNGLISFGSGNTSYSESVSGHQARTQIAVYWDDLNPSSGGSIKYTELSDRLIIHYDDLHEYSNWGNRLEAQVELRYNGEIAIHYSRVDMHDGIVGLSAGSGSVTAVDLTDSVTVNPTIVFADAALALAIQEALGIGSGDPIYTSALLGLTSLNLSGLGVTDLTGLEAATNLRILNIRGNTFDDIDATFAILDQLPLYCLYRDFPRASGVNPGNLTEVEVSDTNGDSIYVIVDTAELETLDVSDGVIDTSDASNLVILQTLEDQGVTIETGDVNLAPAAAATALPLDALDDDGDGFAAVTLNGSSSGDIDGSVVSYVWTWSGGSASGVSASVQLPIGDTEVTLTVTDDGGLTDSTPISVTVGIDYTFNSASDVLVTADGFTASGDTANITLNFAPATGTSLTVVNNTGLGFISGTFSNIAQGQPLTLSYNGITYNFVANYYGGTGNDLVLQWGATQIAAWGYNGRGELGDDSQLNSSVPVEVDQSGLLAGKTVISLVGSNGYTVALCSDGTLAAWGSNDYGQLGNNSQLNSSVPVAVDQSGVLVGKTVISVAARLRHTVALCSDGTLAAWGSNNSGQLGDNSTTNSSVPVVVDQSGVLAGKTVISVAAGNSHSVALCSDGTVVAWGYNGSGQLGNNSTTNSSVPVVVDQTGVLAGKTVISVAAGNSHSVALCSDGTVVAWGYNNYGQLGSNGTTRSLVPITVDQNGVLAGKSVVSVAAGSSHTVALCFDGTLASWGYNNSGQLGNNSTTRSSVPIAVDQSGVLAGKSVVSVAAGSSHTVALCSDKTLATWGHNGYGQLGNNTTTQSLVPVAVEQGGVLAGKTVISVAGGNIHSLALVGSRVIPPVVLFNDAALLTAIRTSLGIPDGSITPEDMEALTNLDLSSLGITDLSGLEFATNLRILNIRGNAFTDPAGTWAILDELPLYCLYADLPRPSGDSVGLLTEAVTDTNGSTFYIVVDAPNLPTLDLAGLGVDLSEQSNLVALQAFEDAGVTVDGLPANQEPSAIANHSVLDAETGEVQFDASLSTDPDGSIVSYTWTWSTGSASGVNPTDNLPIGNTSVTLLVTDDRGGQDSTTFTVGVVLGPGMLVETRKLLPNDGDSSDYFGSSVVASGDLAVVGAPFDEEKGGYSGSAYVFNLGTELQVRKHLPSGYDSTHDYFGGSAAISGNLAVIGATYDSAGVSSSGSAYVYNLTTGQLQSKLMHPTPSGWDGFGGDAVAISGNLVVVGADGDDENGEEFGSAFVFYASTGQQRYKLLPNDGASNDDFGKSVAISGNLAVIGAAWDDDNGSNSGSAYVFDLTTGQQLRKLLPTDGASGDNFGASMAMLGNLVVIGAPGDNDFGSDSGSAYVFDVTTGQQLHKLLPNDGATYDDFGQAVAISSDLIVVGAPERNQFSTWAGSAYVFDIATGQQLMKLVPSDGDVKDGFGGSVAVSDTYILIGAAGDDDNGDGSGSAYIFELGGSLIPVTVPDAALLTAIRAELEIPTDPITREDMEGLTNLDLSGLAVTDLTGLEAATNLRVLNIRGNTFDDIDATFAILDQLPLYCLYRDFPRSSGVNPANLIEVVVSDSTGADLYVTVDTAELETLDVSDGSIDTTNPDNLIILQTLQDQGVTIETGNLEIPPTAVISILGGTIDSDYNGVAAVALDGSASDDFDGSITAWNWASDESGASGESATLELPVGVTQVTLTVTDDDGLTASRSIDVEVTQILEPRILIETYGSLLTFDASTGARLADFLKNSPSSLELADPELGPDGDIYAIDKISRGRVFRFDGGTGEYIETLLEDPAFDILGMTFGPAGNLYVISGSLDVLVVDPESGTPFASIIELNNPFYRTPSGIAFHNGELIVTLHTGEDGTQIQRYNPENGNLLGQRLQSTWTEGAGSGLSASNGQLLIPVPLTAESTYTSSEQSGVIRYTVSNTIAFAGLIDQWGGGYYPQAIREDDDGSLIVLNSSPAEWELDVEYDSYVTRLNLATGAVIEAIIPEGTADLQAGVSLLLFDAIPFTEVTFADPQLEACIRLALGQPDGIIRSIDLLSIINLNLSNKNISNLSGLEFATNLRILNIRGNTFDDVDATYAILDQLPLYCLYTDLPRPGGDSVGLLTEAVTDTSGNTFYIVVDAPNLPTLDVSGLGIDTSEPSNLAALQVFEDAGVTVDGVPDNQGPSANASYSVLDIATGQVRFDASGSTDPDGSIVSYTWTWSTGSTSGENPTDNLPLGDTSVTLVVTDNRGGQDSTNFTVTLTPTASVPDLVRAYAPADFSASTAADFPQVSVPLVGALPLDLYFDIELVNISNLNSQYGSFIGAGFLSSGSFLGEFQIGADRQIGSSDGIFGELRGNDDMTSASLDSGGIPEGTRVWFRLSSNGDTVTAQVINQADGSVIYSGSYSIPGAQTADALVVRTYDNEGTITPTLVTGGAEDYWVIRSTRSGVDMTVNFYGVSVAGLANSDSDPGSDAWETANGFDPNVDGDVGTLDSDGDGDLDIFEIFQGTDRNGSSESYGFQAVGSTTGVDELTAQFRRSKSQTAVRAVSQWSCDLVNWYDSGESAEGITVATTETVVSDHPDYEIVEAKTEVTSGSSACLFYRLELIPIE